MKTLLTVMAVVLCVYLSMGFTVHTNNNSTKPINLHSRAMRWKHTTWVNPWVKTNTKALLANNLLFEISTSPGHVASVCKITYSGGVTVDLRESCYYCYQWLTVPNTPVTFDFQIDYNEFYGQICWLSDETTGEELFESTDLTQTFTWTPIAGHIYDLSANF